MVVIHRAGVPSRGRWFAGLLLSYSDLCGNVRYASPRQRSLSSVWLDPVFSLISKTRLHVVLRVISGLVVALGIVLLAIDLATSLRVVKHPGAHGGGSGLVFVEHIRFVSIFFFLLGSGLFASSLLWKK